MTERNTITSAISNFVMRVCFLERSVELRRQQLCDKNDFEPYAAFKRIRRDEAQGITAFSLSSFLGESLVANDLYQCENVARHYESNLGTASVAYKEFLELVLPKEHADLRAFVTQRACYDVEREEFLSYETEAALATLLENEINFLDELMTELKQLENVGIGPVEIVAEITGQADSPIKFNDLQDFLQEAGLLPYE